MKRLLIVAPLMLVFCVGLGSKSNEPAKLRVANLAPDVKAVDVMIGSKLEFRNIPAKSISHYLSIPAGKHEVKMVAAGQKEPVLAELSGKFKAERSYTLALNGSHKLGDLKIVDLSDEHKVDAEKAKVRFVNLAPDTAAIDVLDAKGDKVFKGVSFRKNAGYTKLSPGEHSFSLQEKGKKTPILTIKGMKLEAGKNYTIFTIGEVKDKSLAAVHAMDGESVKTTQPAEVKTAEPTKKPEPAKKPAKAEHHKKAAAAPTTQKAK